MLSFKSPFDAQIQFNGCLHWRVAILSLSDGKPTVQQSLSVVEIVSRAKFWLASAKETFVHTIILFLCVFMTDSVSSCFEMYSNGPAVLSSTGPQRRRT